VLHIGRAVKHALDPRQLVIAATKTHSERHVSMDELAMAVLATHRERAEHAAGRVGVVLSPDAYVLSLDPSGAEPMRPDSLGGSFSRLAHQQGAELRFHDLRHFSATQLKISDVAPTASFDMVRDQGPIRVLGFSAVAATS
jgi:integrase